MPSPLGLSREAPNPVSGDPTATTPPGSGIRAVDVSGLVAKRYDDIIKGSEDKRSYRGLELTNKLKVLLVSDPVTDKSAAAVDVNVGYLSDPDYLPGLAHFCEHMLFLGTKKYPEENEYSKFLSEHGGSYNAETGSDHTCYFFDVLPEHLAPTLDVFAQFFISPLFTAAMTERELNAVHSEHEQNISNDTWRLEQLNKSTADPGHPYSKFGTGNKETLELIPREKGVDVRQELLQFYSTWYSANLITLCVLGKESLDELESMVVPLFSAVTNSDAKAPSWPEHPFPPERRRKRAFAVPIKDLRSMSVDFPIPDMHLDYRSSHGQYLSHLFLHEGPGSLLSELKARGWCNSVAGGEKPGGRGFSFFGVRVDLTEEGQKHIDDIVTLVFQYINLLKSAPPQPWIFEEQSRLMALSFNFQDTQEPSNFVSSDVHDIQEYPMEDVLSAHYLLTEWKPAQIQELLEYLVVDNVRVSVASKAFENRCKETERWYGTKYLLEDVEENVLQSWRTCGLCPSLRLPLPNEFIPSNLDIAPRESSDLPVGVPTVVKDTPFLRLWFRQDDEFLLPKASVTIEFVSPLAYSDPTNCNLTTLWVLLLMDALVEFVYAAELTDLNWNISNAQYGITISIEGYDDKQHVLLEKIVSRIASFHADPKRFAIMKENHIRTLKNFEAEQPYQHAVHHLVTLLAEHAWTQQQLLDGAKGLTVEMVEEFASRFMRRAHVEALILGNMTRERALQLAAIVEQQVPKNAIPLLPQQLLLNREVQLEKGSHYLMEVHNTVHKNSCTELYYQCGLLETRANVVLELLLQIISEPCFNILRTKEQLGYIVFSGIRRSNGVQGLLLIVQSEKHPAVVEARVEAFLHHMKDYITEMPAEEFTRHKQALAAQRLQKPKQLGARAGQMWLEILSQQYNFERARLEVSELESVTKEELLKYYEQYVSVESPDRQKLAVHVISVAEGGAGSEKGQGVDSAAGGDDGLLPVPEEKIKAVKITDIVEFKTKHSLFPYSVPAMVLPRKGTHCKL